MEAMKALVSTGEQRASAARSLQMKHDVHVVARQARRPPDSTTATLFFSFLAADESTRKPKCTANVWRNDDEGSKGTPFSVLLLRLMWFADAVAAAAAAEVREYTTVMHRCLWKDLIPGYNAGSNTIRRRDDRMPKDIRSLHRAGVEANRWRKRWNHTPGIGKKNVGWRWARWGLGEVGAVARWSMGLC